METDEKSAAIERFLRGHEPFAEKPLYAPGETVGDWRVLAFLGHGGSGEVYRAENVRLGTIGALKALTRGDDKAKERFRLEARLLSRATCAAFPRFCAYGEADGRPYVVTEVLEPMDLPSTDRAVADFIEKVCVGVAELHRLGYVHRDIKPANIMRRPATGEPVLIDLGLVRSSDDRPDGRNSTTSIVDGRAVGVGTPGYSAPEQFSGGNISPAADIHALGILANACFKGRPPRVWAGIIRRSTSSIPEQRYASVEAFVKAVRHRRRGRRVAIGVALGLTAILGVFIWATSINGGDYWIRQAWLAGRQMRSIKDLRFTDEELRQVFQDTSSENIDTTVRIVKWKDIGETKVVNGTPVTTIWLDEKTLKVTEPVVLDGKRKVYIAGPGLLDADISGAKGVTVEIARNAALINRSPKPYPESGITYSLRGESYLNFLNQKWPEDKDIRNVYVDGENEIIRFGGPLTYREARQDAYKQALEAHRRDAERRRKSHDLRDAGVREAF